MRQETLIIFGAALVVVVVGVFALLSVRGGAAPAAPSAVADIRPSAAADVPFTTLVQGTQSSVSRRVNYLATSASELEELWKMANATSTPPAVDFATQEVIGVFAGQQPAPGYAIAISKIEDATARVVSVTIARPEETCTQKPSATAPYEIVAVPATALPLTHEDISTTTGCP